MSDSVYEYGFFRMLRESSAEIERLRKELDEARREICLLRASSRTSEGGRKMTDDIVARLRLYAERQKQTRSTVLGLLLSDSADEIERLGELSGDSGQLREERNEARREICLLRASSTNATEKVSAELEEYARSRGWENLFGEDR